MTEGEGAKAPRRIQVGEETYTVARFKGYKAFRIGRMLTELGEIGPQIQSKVSKFMTQYREENVERIPRATLEFRYAAEAAAVSEEAWKESGGVIQLARDPSEAEILAIALPAAFELAGERVVDLLAWVVASDQELEAKDIEGGEQVENYIDDLKKKLLYRGDIDELLELALAARDVLGEQMKGKAERARSLLALVGLGEDSEETDPTPEEEKTPEEETPQPATVSIEKDPETEVRSTPESTSTSPRPASSTDSPPPMDGDEEMSSMASAGAPSASTSG